jgi:DNA-binding beta-propeller fold protein YncE
VLRNRRRLDALISRGALTEFVVVVDLSEPGPEGGEFGRARPPPPTEHHLGLSRIVAIVVIGILLAATLVTGILPGGPCGSPSTCVLGSIDAGSGPGDMVYDNGSGHLFVLNNGPGLPDSSVWGVTVINGSTDTVVGFYHTWQRANYLAYDPRNGDLYITSFLFDDIYVLNATNGANVTWISTPLTQMFGGPGAVAYDPVTGFIVSIAPPFVLLIDGSTNQIISERNLDVGSYPMAVNSRSGQIYVTTAVSPFSFNLTVLNGFTGTVEWSVQLNGTPHTISYDALHGRIYVAEEIENFGGEPQFSGTLAALDAAGRRFLSSVPVGDEPFGIAVDNSNRNIYVSSYYSNNVSIVNGTTGRPTGAVPVDPGPSSLVYDGRNRCLYALFYTHFGSGGRAGTGGDGYVSVIAPPGAVCPAPPTSWSPPLWTITLAGALLLTAVVVLSAAFRRRPWR